MQTKRQREIYLCTLLASTIFLADRLSKWLVLVHLEPHNKVSIPFFDFFLVWNKGVSWGIFNQAHSVIQIGILTAAIVAMLSIFLVITIKNFHKGHTPWLESLVIGGGISNLIDRMWYGAVIDFIDFHVDTIHWPTIFNVADVFIVAGVLGILIRDIFSPTLSHKQK